MTDANASTHAALHAKLIADPEASATFLRLLQAADELEAKAAALKREAWRLYRRDRAAEYTEYA